MDKFLKDSLVCPQCMNKLNISENKLECSKCKKLYFYKNNIPIFDKITDLNGKAISHYSYREKIMNEKGIYPALLKIQKILTPPISSFSKTKQFNNNKVDIQLYKFLKSLVKDAKILNIGSGSSKRLTKNTYNLDIDIFDNIDVVANGRKLPFKDNCFDAVIILCVLEHVARPLDIVNEIYRVLKRNGKVYSSIPFVFAFHGSPHDFNRFTKQGHDSLFSKFKKIDSGVLCGANVAISQILRYYLALLFSFNNDFLFSFFLNVFGWLTFPIKYLDIIFINYKQNEIIAASTYFTGKK